MSEKLRTAFVLFEIEGYSGEEIARIQDIPLGTVWTRLHLARKEFWKLLTKQREAEERGAMNRLRDIVEREGGLRGDPSVPARRGVAAADAAGAGSARDEGARVAGDPACDEAGVARSAEPWR